VERLENLADEGKRETNSGIESSYSTVVADSSFSNRNQNLPSVVKIFNQIC